MPTYEYRCRDCGHTFDVVQRMTDEPLTVCPNCGGELRKVFAPPAISFKGSGFYATDHGKRAEPAGDGKAAEGAGAKADTKKDSTDKGATTASGEGKTEKSSPSTATTKESSS